MATRNNILIAVILMTVMGCNKPAPPPSWPPITNEQKPWTRWWWHGSAVTKEGITAELEAYAKAGLGGVEITPIYGVHGHEDQFIQFLSDEWIEMFIHTLNEAERLGLGVDMATGTGWPFGGPWVTDTDACKNIFHNVYLLSEGQTLTEKITFTQPPFLRAVGTQVYEVHDNAASEGRVVAGTRKEPLQKFDPANISIELLKQPVSSNEDLQSLALDQVQFERPLKLLALMAYNEQGESIDLTDAVGDDGTLTWVAPRGNWKLYAMFQGWHGKMVERAGPGGEGNVIDHFSQQALSNYLSKFDSALSGRELGSLRAFFNDSYEVDDARGAADWTPTLLKEFADRRGYSLLNHLPALFGHGDAEDNERILHDYRLTISELLLENFTQSWAEWAHGKKKLVRNQAHGAPANILDLYAAIDIPETEGTEPLRIKMATSAGNVTGKKLISSESATWLDEHFLSGLGDIKANVDRYLVNGVNHVLYHGTSYSPPGEPWPGWLFYAAVHLNPRNSQWSDFAALNRYIARCQSMLQRSTSNNDVLLYYPISDRYSTSGPEMIEHFDGPVNAFKGSSFMNAADTLLAVGYAFDFISDKQLQNTQFESAGLKTRGNRNYKTIVVPHCKYMPIATVRSLVRLMDEGAAIIFYGGLPESTAGYATLKEDQTEFSSLLDRVKSSTADGPGIARKGNRLTDLLSAASVLPERMVELGVTYNRRTLENGHTAYFILNSSSARFEGWLPFSAKATSAVIRDPMAGVVGAGIARSADEGASVFLQLNPGQSLLVELMNEQPQLPSYPLFTTLEASVELDSSWHLEFLNGGPVLPGPLNLDTVVEWTSLLTPETASFSGTASYSTTFRKPEGKQSSFLLSFGGVGGTASVFVNGDSVATIISQPYEVWLDSAWLARVNKLEVRVSNLMANRISDLDRRGIAWKKFYNVNFPARKPENRRDGIFNSSEWKPINSGLRGPVTITPGRPLQVPF